MEKLNIAEILKDCPKGMELDCTMFDDVYFDYIDDVSDIINCYIQNSKHKTGISFNKYGHYSSLYKAKCVIFPKGKTTWEGFKRPFKDGDVVTWEDRGSLVACIYKERKNTATFNHHIALYKGGLGIVVNGEIALTDDELCLATEEEKKKLFDAIKANGYKWNPNTKTLVKLIVPKFKEGDRVKHISAHTPGIVVKVDDQGYYINYPKGNGVCYISFILEKDYELLPNKFDITTLKPFESKVLVRSANDDIWRPAIYGFTDSDKYYVVGGIYWKQCIPYEVNKELLGTTNNPKVYGTE